MAEWARYFSIKVEVLYHRLEDGIPMEEAVKTQRRTNYKMVTIRGETRPLHYWAKVAGVSQSTFWQRIKMGWTEERLLLPLQRKKITAWNKTQSFEKWEAETGVPACTIWYRIRVSGLTPEQAMTMPIDKNLSSRFRSESEGQKPYQESRKTDLVGD